MNHHRLSEGAFVLSLLLLPVATAQPVAAQDAPAAEAEAELPKARAVVDRFLEKAKLREVLEKHKSAHIKASFELVGMDIKGELDLYAAKPDKLYTKLVLGPMGEVRQGTLDGVSWRIHPMIGTGLLEGMERFQFLQQADWSSLLKDPKKFESMRTVGREAFEGLDCHVLEFVAKAEKDMDAEKTKRMRTHREYYSVETGLLVGVENLTASPMGEAKTVSHLTDYKDMGGSLMAAKTTVKAAGMHYEIRFASVEYDKVEPEVFALPAEIQKLVAAEKAKREERQKEPPVGGGSGR